MSSQLPADPVSLEDLKRAIEAVPNRPPGYLTELMLVYLDMRGRAWRTAFEWREGVLLRFQEQFFPGQAEIYIAELEGGMKLIREKLQS